MIANELGPQQEREEEQRQREMISRMKPSRRRKIEETIAYDALGRPAAKEHTGGSS
jgi:hypothetical protein